MEHLQSAPPWGLFLVLLLVSGVSSEVTGNLSCWYDTFATLSCTWSPNTSYADAACILEANAENDDIQASCNMTVNGGYPGSCQLFLDENRKAPALTIGHRLQLLLKCSSANRSYVAANLRFRPYSNVQLNPPHSLQFKNLSEARVNLTWTCENHYYVHGKRIYQVRYRPVGESWENLDIVQDQMWVEMPALRQADYYEVQVRVHQKKYQGRWSDWSNALEWHAPPAGLPLAIGQDQSSFLFVGGMCVAGVLLSGALLVFACRKTCRLRKYFCPLVPDPSRFFKPLLTLHGGELKLSLSSAYPPSSFSHVDSATKISPVEVVTREDQTSVLISVFPDLTTAYENSGHSQCSFHNLGYFQCPDTLEKDPCHVYFTDEALGAAESAILTDRANQGLSFADSSLLCHLHSRQPLTIDTGICCIRKGYCGVTCNPHTPEEHSQPLLSQTHHPVECEKADASQDASTQDLAMHKALPRVETKIETGQAAFRRGSGDTGALLEPAYVNTRGHASAQRVGTDEYLTLRDLQLQYGSNMTVAGIC